MKKTRVLLADDHKIVLEGLKNILDSEFDLVGAVEDGRKLVKETEKLHPDVIVVDISMPLLNGIEAVEQIKKVNEDTKVIFLTMHPEVAYATRAFEAGAAGYVLKHSAPSELVTAIKEVTQGRTYITPMIAGELLEIHSLLSLLCNELGGGGIVQARHLEPMLASAVPKLRDAVDAMQELSEPLNGDSAPGDTRLI